MPRRLQRNWKPIVDLASLVDYYNVVIEADMLEAKTKLLQFVEAAELGRAGVPQKEWRHGRRNCADC